MDNLNIIKQLDECKDVIKKDLGDNIYSYNFARHVFYKDLWTDLTCKARGLFINKDDNSIVARSYDKFFYITADQKFTFPVDVYIKENGFLGICSYNPKTDDLLFASKSTNKGKHAEIFKKRLLTEIKDRDYNWNCDKVMRNIDDLKQYTKENKCSFVFEVIDIADDPHIIKYNNSGCILLDVIKNDFTFSKMPYNDLRKLAKEFTTPIKFKQETLKDEFALNKWLERVQSTAYRNELEGYVLEDATGFMCKVKTPFYQFWKHIRTLRDKVLAHKQLTAEDIKSVEEIEVLKFMKTLPEDILSEMSIPTLRDRFNFEKRKEDRYFEGY